MRAIPTTPARRQQARQQWLAWWTKTQAEFPPSRPLPRSIPARLSPRLALTLRTLEGARISLRRPEKPLLLHFWGTWCGACQQELPHLTAFHRKYGNQVQVVGVAFDEPAGARGLQQFCARGAHTRRLAWRRAHSPKRFDIHGVPQSVLIDTLGAHSLLVGWRARHRDFRTRGAEASEIAVSRLPANRGRSPHHSAPAPLNHAVAPVVHLGVGTDPASHSRHIRARSR